ncbi:hypothetical protein [Pseudonocardia xishanensis]|uniref:Secreted protein n=1 Tax=Pseudonocardia xishanensis TaxID=630995 RepID=A0ABP8S102_9PSEU
MVLLYVVAFAGAAVIALLLWRAMNGDRAEIPRGTGAPRTSGPARRTRPTGPDDDPDFLRSLDESLRRDGEDPPAER